MDTYMTFSTELENFKRTDWHHNEFGEVDYLPIKGAEREGFDIPLAEQKYDYEYEAMREEAATNMAILHSKRTDWDEYERIMREFN